MRVVPYLSADNLNAPVRIGYTNGSGEYSERLVLPKHVFTGRNGHTYLRAYCSFREEERTFRVDRISWWEEVRGPQYDPRPEPLRTAGVRTYVSAWQAEAEATRTAGTAAPPASPEEASACDTAHPARSLAWVLAAFFALALLLSADEAERAAGDLLEAAADTLVDWLSPAQHERPAPYRVEDLLASLPRTTPPAGKPRPPAPTHSATYRGAAVMARPSGAGTVFSAPAYGLSAPSERDLHLALNAAIFREVTGIADSRLEQVYARADGDRDGYLTWKEITAFQGWLARSFRYRTNVPALRPDRFLAQGGGDCEDWALFSCGLLRYCRYPAYDLRKEEKLPIYCI